MTFYQNCTFILQWLSDNSWNGIRSQKFKWNYLVLLYICKATYTLYENVNYMWKKKINDGDIHIAYSQGFLQMDH